MRSQHEEKAVQLFCDGYNCAQAVVGAFAEDIGMEEDQVLALASGLGGGIAGLRRTCGAELGAVLVIGKIYFEPNHSETKQKVATIVRQLMDQFQKRNDENDQCAFLRERPALKQETENIAGMEDFPKAPPCAKYVIDCVELLESIISSMP